MEQIIVKKLPHSQTSSWIQIQTLSKNVIFPALLAQEIKKIA
jgi:hypothetical protein